MWIMMLECIPKDSKKVFTILRSQYNKVDTVGVTYRLYEATITEKHFDFKNTIIKELKTYVDLINARGVELDFNPIDKQWREGVGGAEKLLPVHVVDEYCSNEPFSPVSKFTTPPKSSRQFYNPETKKYEDWFSTDSKLSINFALFKGANSRCSALLPVQYFWPKDGTELKAMKELCEVRTNGFINLKSYFEEQLAVDNQPKFFSLP